MLHLNLTLLPTMSETAVARLVGQRLPAPTFHNRSGFGSPKHSALWGRVGYTNPSGGIKSLGIGSKGTSRRRSDIVRSTESYSMVECPLFCITER